MDPKELTDVAADDHVVMPDGHATDDAEDAAAQAVHPLVLAVRQLEALQSQIYLAGPVASIQAQSRENQSATAEDAAPYCRLACDVLSCAVSACELWRESLLRMKSAMMMGPGTELSVTELSRLLSKLLASLHILDCLKDTKQALRAALSGVTAQEGDEQQLLSAVQDFFNMPTACLVLLRDMLLEDTTLITRTKQSLLRLLPIQLEAADSGSGMGHDADRKRGSLKSKLGLSTSSSHSAGDGASSSTEGTNSTRSSARIALSLLVHLYCCVDSAEQELLMQQAQAIENANSVTPTGAKAASAATQKLLRACMANLRSTPIVPGYGDVPIDLLRPLQGLPQLPWETLSIVSVMDERYCLSAASANAAQDYGRLVEELLALKLHYESEKNRLNNDARSTSGGGAIPSQTRASGPQPSLPPRQSTHSQAQFSRAAGALAVRALQLLQDWQTAILQLDAFRTWQRRQRQEDELRDAGGEDAAANDQISKFDTTRCAFTSSDISDVVRMVTYIKGLHGVIIDNMDWLEPLLRVHCASHLGQLMTAVVGPVAQGVLGLPSSPSGAINGSASLQYSQQLPGIVRISCEGQQLSAPSSARGTASGCVFASSHVASACAGAPAGPPAGPVDNSTDAVSSLALNLGRMWKNKANKHGGSHSNASSMEVMAPEPRQSSVAVTLPPPSQGGAPAETVAPIGPSQRTTEDSADTTNLIASITADGIDWAAGRPAEFRTTDPYARLREWFANGNNPGTAGIPPVNAPLQSVPEGNTPRSEKSPAAATVASAGRRGMATPTADAGSLATGPSPSVHRGSCNSALAENQWAAGSSARMQATTATDGTEDGVECTVSSVTDCEGLLAALDGEEDAGAQVSGGTVAKASTRVTEPAAKSTEAPETQPAVELQPQQQQSWPATDLLWPPAPLPSSSWLGSSGGGGTVSPVNTVSAGGAPQPTRSPGSGLPRITAPAALSTNPLYVYPSAAREAVAEQERATVAIWMSSEGGAPGSALPALEDRADGSAAPGDVTVAPTVRDSMVPTVRTEAALGSSQQQQLMYECDANGDVRQQGSYNGAHGYVDAVNISHSQLNSSMMARSPFKHGQAANDELGHHVHFETAPPQTGNKKTASSPFKRFKRLFGKRPAGDKATGASAANTTLTTAAFDFSASIGTADPLLDAYYGGGDFTAGMAGFGVLPATYLVDPRELPGLDADSSTIMASHGVIVNSGSQQLAHVSGDYLPGLMAEATSRDGAVAVLSVGPSLPVQSNLDHSHSLMQPQAGVDVDFNAGNNRGKARQVSGSGTALKTGGAAAFLDVVHRAREEKSSQRVQYLANEMQVCLANAGFVSGADGLQRACTMTGDISAPTARKGAGARASLKKLVTSFKAKTGGRQRSGTGSGSNADQETPSWACEAAQGLGLDSQAIVKLRNAAEMMADELEAMLANRRSRGKASKEGPSLMQLISLSSELRAFLHSSMPSLEPLLAFRVNLAAATDLSPLMVLDPSRSYGTIPGNGLGADARGSVPWELANKGVLVNTMSEHSPMVAAEMPLAAGLTVLTLFKDAIEAMQLQQAHAITTGYPEPPTAGRLQQLYRRQCKWCLNTFIQTAARKVWGTYKAQAVRTKLGLVMPPGAPDVAASTMAFHGLFRPSHEDNAPQQVLFLSSTRPDQGPEADLTVVDMLAAAIDDLARQAASRVAEMLLGSDLTVLVAVKQQLDVLSLAVTRLRRELPIRPWNDVWLAALAARAASSPTCASIADAAAATASAVTQGCGSGAAGLTITAEEIILTHACSVPALRTLSTWSYDMTAVRFRPTKHTKNIWDGLVGNATKTEAASPLLFPDGADILLASLADASNSKCSGRSGEGCSSFFGRSHLQAMHGMLGLDGIARWVAALRRHAVELLADAAPLFRRVHEMYDNSLAGPRGPGMREAGGASGYLQLQQRWLRDRGHSELLVSAHRAMQALGNTVAAAALADSVLAELCVSRAPHLLSLTASALQADQQAHAALKAAAAAETSGAVGPSLVKPPAPPAVPPPPRGSGLAGLLLGQPLPPGLMLSTQSAVQAAALVQERMQEQLPAAFGLPGLWQALQQVLSPAHGPQLFSAARLWSVIQVQLSCLSPEEQVIHSTNVGDGVYVSAAAVVQLAAGAPVAPGSVLNGDTMTSLQEAVVLEQLKADVAAATANQGSSGLFANTSGSMEKATFEQLRAWSVRAEAVRTSWDRAVQLTVGAGTVAAKVVAGQKSSRNEASGTSVRSLDTPALSACNVDPWASLAQQAAATGMAVLIRAAAAAAAAPPPQAAHAQHAPQSQGGAAAGSRQQPVSVNGRPLSQQGLSLNQTVPTPSRNAPPRPPVASCPQAAAVTQGVPMQRTSVSGPPLPPRMVPASPGGNSQHGRSPIGASDGSLQQQQQLQQLRAASQVLLRSPRGEGTGLGTYGLFTIAGSTAAQSRSRAASSLGDWGHME